MRVARIVPNRRTEICEDPIHVGEEVRIGSDGCGAEEGK